MYMMLGYYFLCRSLSTSSILDLKLWGSTVGPPPFLLSFLPFLYCWKSLCLFSENGMTPVCCSVDLFQLWSIKTGLQSFECYTSDGTLLQIKMLMRDIDDLTQESVSHWTNSVWQNPLLQLTTNCISAWQVAEKWKKDSYTMNQNKDQCMSATVSSDEMSKAINLLWDKTELASIPWWISKQIFALRICSHFF